MSYLSCVPFLLCILLGYVSTDQPPIVETADVRDMRNNASTPQPQPSRNYTCMEDWDKTCKVDSECCSGTCNVPFCKTIGIEKPPKCRRKGCRKNRNKTPGSRAN